MPETQQAEQAPTSLSPDQAVTKLEALLGADKPDEEQQQPPDASQAQAPDTPETPVEEPDQAPAVDEPEEPDAEPEAEEQADDDPLYAVQIDGKEVPIPVSELANGYLRQSDYTKKTQEVAQARQALEAHYAEVQKERAIYGNMLGQLEQALGQLNPQEPNWEQLMAQDVGQYWVERARWEEYGRKTTAIREEQARVQQLQQIDTVERLKGHLTSAQTYLVEQIPEWRDEKRATADRQKIREHAKSLGYNEAEISRAYDPRMIVAVRESMLYRQLMAGRPRQALGNRPVLRPGSAANQTPSKVTRITKLKQRLARTGRPEDGLAALEAMIL